MVRAIICDDNRHILNHYQDILKEIAVKNGIDLKITQCENGEQLLFLLSDNPNKVDIIYLDILMGEINGIETAKNLRNIGCMAQIIYLTTSNEYVFEAFDVEPYYYIVKDEVSKEKFKEIFLKAVESIKKRNEDFILVASGSTTIKLQLDKILYFEIRNRLVTVHTLKDSIDYYSTLDEIEQSLKEKGFVRCHRSYLVNCYHIQKLTRTKISLSDETEIPVSAKYTHDVQTSFSKYLLQI